MSTFEDELRFDGAQLQRADLRGISKFVITSNSCKDIALQRVESHVTPQVLRQVSPLWNADSGDPPIHPGLPRRPHHPLSPRGKAGGRDANLSSLPYLPLAIFCVMLSPYGVLLNPYGFFESLRVSFESLIKGKGETCLG